MMLRTCYTGLPINWELGEQRVESVANWLQIRIPSICNCAWYRINMHDAN